MDIRWLEILPTLSLVAAVLAVAGVGMYVLPWTESERQETLRAWTHALDVLVARLAAPSPDVLCTGNPDELIPAPSRPVRPAPAAVPRVVAGRRLALVHRRERADVELRSPPRRHPIDRLVRVRPGLLVTSRASA